MKQVDKARAHSVYDVSGLLGISVKRVRYLIDTHRLRCFHVGYWVLVSDQSLHNYITWHNNHMRSVTEEYRSLSLEEQEMSDMKKAWRGRVADPEAVIQ